MSEPERLIVLDLHALAPEPPADLLPWSQLDRAVLRRRRQRGGVAALGTAAATVAAIVIAVVASGRGPGPAPVALARINGALIVAEFRGTPPTQLINTDLVTVAPNGSTIRELTAGPGADLAAAVSPDGRTVAYVHETTTRTGPTSFKDHDVLRLVGIDGGDSRQVYACASFCHDLAWSSDGRSLAFVDNGIRVLTSSGAVHLLCGRNCVLAAAEPTWSPDGSRIAFSQRDVRLNVGTYIGPSAIFVIDSNGGGLRKLTNRSCRYSGPGCSIDTGPAWSPSGDLIAFSRVEQPTTPNAPASAATGLARGVFTVAPDGSEAQQLWRCPTLYCQQLDPKWSPDGSLVAVHDNSLNAAYIINTRSGDAVQVPTPGAGRQVVWTSAAWAPDGTKLALTLARGAAAGAIYTVDRDGSNLTKLPVPDVYGPDPALDWAPAAAGASATLTPSPGPRPTRIDGTPKCPQRAAQPSTSLQITATNKPGGWFDHPCLDAPSDQQLRLTFTNNVYALQDHQPVILHGLYVFRSSDLPRIRPRVPISWDLTKAVASNTGLSIAGGSTIGIAIPPLDPGTYTIFVLPGYPQASATLTVS